MTQTMTPWGYSVEGTLPPLLSVTEFNTLTGSRWANDPMLSTTLAAASQAIRDFCGWHVSPSLTCYATCYGNSRLLHLPFRGVSAIAKVEINGVELPSTAYRLDARQLGEVYRTDGYYWPCFGWTDIEVKATAGYPATIMPVLSQVLVQLVSTSLASPIGVKEEHAGQVGITYNAPGGIAGGVTLTDRDMACLAPYRVEEVA